MISIIVPIYNAEKSIEKCIKSILNQTKKELEIILVNDGSTDNTDKIIKTFKDKRIKYFVNKNQGIGKTRNFGISKATSEYIMFLDSDDYLREDACELLFNKIDSESLDMVVCDYYTVEANKIDKYNIPSFENASLKENPELLNIINLGPCNKIYRASLIKKNNIKYVEDLKYEDAPFVAEVMDKSTSIGKIDECLYYYVVHENSETTVRDERIFDILKIVDKIRNIFKDRYYLKENLDKLTVRIITNYTIQQRMQLDKKIAMDFIDKAFSYLEKEIPDYKNNKYYENRGIKKIIEKNKLLTKLYVKLYKK